MVLVDIMPLEDPKRGSDESLVVWFRECLSKAVISFCVTEQHIQHVPRPTLS